MLVAGPLELLIEAVQSGVGSWYDLAACAYEVVDRSVNNHETFIARYLDCDERGESQNPNLGRLENLKDELCQEMHQARCGQKLESEALFSIIDLLKIASEELARYEDPRLNELTLVYTVVKAVDLSAGVANAGRKRFTRGPLNEIHHDRFGVYLKSDCHIVGSVAARFGCSRIPEYRMNDQLQNIVFFEGGNKIGLPRVCASRRSCEAGVESKDGNRLVVGLAPFSGECIHAFDEQEDKPLQLVMEGGKSFGARYRDGYAKIFSRSVIAVLDEAINQGCQVLVFPELAMSERLQTVLGKNLKRRQDVGSLSLVVAGSGWDASTGNNICRLYDCRGVLLGSYYKYAPFSSVRDGCVEGLSDPGKECTLVDVPNIGRMVPAVCKDAISVFNDYTRRLVETFDPALVCVPAWSASVERGFAQSFEVMAKGRFAVPCLSNYCGVRKGSGETTVDIVVAPRFDQVDRRTRVSTERIDVQRPGKCRRECKDGFCFWKVVVDYASDGEEGHIPKTTVERIARSFSDRL